MKKDIVRMMMLGTGPCERIKREVIMIEIDTAAIDELNNQDHSRQDSVDGSLADSLVRDGTISHYNISIGSCNKIVN